MPKNKLFINNNNNQMIRLSINSPKCDKAMSSAEHPF